MKNILLILAIAFSSASFAQGNLQFNQVKLVGSAAETVPTGKIWKIESATYSPPPTWVYNAGGLVVNENAIIQINGNNRTIRSIRGEYYNGAAGQQYWEQTFPIWLPAGTTLSAGALVYELSIIEFNVVP